MIIYQIFTRLFGNDNTTRQKSGTLAVNGCGKLNDITPEVLRKIRTLGVSHIWYTGLIRHATQTDYTSYGIPQQHAEIVKGKAGSPYAIADYYDVDPDLATQVEHRMEECEALIARTHKAGLKVVMDFVPNHVAREYHSIYKPDGVKDLGEDDRTDYNFSPQNNFYYCWGQPLDLSAITSGSSYREQPAKATGNDQFTARPDRNDWKIDLSLNDHTELEIFVRQDAPTRPSPEACGLRHLAFCVDKDIVGLYVAVQHVFLLHRQKCRAYIPRQLFYL